ncbi:MAG TPA: NTP transferase domain-containing protein [Trueperaceae bacterium]
MNACAVVVLAAGAGTRMRSSRHKVLHEAAGQPLLEHVLRAVDPLHARRVVVVIGHLGEQVRDAFRERAESGRLTFAEQRELLGTGHALAQAEGAVRTAFAAGEVGTVLVLNGDGPLVKPQTLKRMLEAQGGVPGMSVLVATVSDPAGLGRVVRAGGNEIARIAEEKDATEDERAIREINAGAYAFDLDVFERCRRLPSDNAQGEQYITGLVDLYLAEGLPVRAVPATVAEEALAVNDQQELAIVDRALRAR